MIHLAKDNGLFNQRMADLCLLKDPEKMIAFYRNGLLFALNFNPTQSLTNVLVPVKHNADYTVVLSTDDDIYGGQNLVEHMTYPTKKFDGQNYVELYLPARTAVVLKETIKPEVEEVKEPVKEEAVKAKKAPAKAKKAAPKKETKKKK